MIVQSGSEVQSESRALGLRIPIRWKVSLFASLLLIVLAVTLGLTGFFAARAILLDQIQARLNAIATGRQKLLLAYTDQQLERAALVASRTKFRELAYEQFRGIKNEAFAAQSEKILDDALESTQGFRAIWLADMQGQVICATDSAYLGQDFSANEDFLVGQKQGHLGKPFFKDDVWQAYITAPVTASDETQLGVLMVLLNVTPMKGFLDDTAGLGESGEVVLEAPHGDYLSTLFPTRYSVSGQKPLPDKAALTIGDPGQPYFSKTIDYRGKAVLAARVAVGYEDWSLEVKMDSEEANKPIMDLCVWSLLLTSLVLLGGIFASVLMARAFTHPILLLTQSAAAVADGQLPDNEELSENNAEQLANDEIGDLRAAFQKMTGNLRRQRIDLHNRITAERSTRQEVEQLSENLQSSLRAEREARERMEGLLQGIRAASSELSQTASQILRRTLQQSANCSQQAVSVADTSVTIRELDEAARQSTEHAKNVSVSATRAEQVGTSGLQAIYDSIKAIEVCRQQAETIGESISRLQSRATMISDIILAVSDLAEETNVLALNAAVEAARAGEHGKGFAVVASEVKSLADQSKKSTIQVSKILAEIREATNAAVLMAEQGRTSVGNANSIIKKSEQTIESLTDTINEAALASAQILAATRDQAGAISQINESMESTKRASDEMLDSAREIENLAQELDHLSNRLQELIAENGSARSQSPRRNIE